jgi:hypothetical protein
MVRLPLITGIRSTPVLALRAPVCWAGLVDAADLARRFALGQAARLSDAPVARGKQGLVWRLETADGRWAVKMPFDRSSEDEVRWATAFQEAACAAGVPAPRVRGHFSMLIAQLGHITEIAGTDWLKPNPRSPTRADSAAWIGEILDEPHTRELLETILAAA